MHRRTGQDHLGRGWALQGKASYVFQPKSSRMIVSRTYHSNRQPAAVVEHDVSHYLLLAQRPEPCSERLELPGTQKPMYLTSAGMHREYGAVHTDVVHAHEPGVRVSYSISANRYGTLSMVTETPLVMRSPSARWSCVEPCGTLGRVEAKLCNPWLALSAVLSGHRSIQTPAVF